jgi:hypothetical protein
MPRKDGPLLDANWLLGPAPAEASSIPASAPQSKQSSKASYLKGAIAFGVFVGSVVLVAPVISRLWLKSTLESTLLYGPTNQERQDALIALSAMLPDTIPSFVEAITSQDESLSRSAISLLDDFLNELASKNYEQQNASYAAILHAMESATQTRSSWSRNGSTADASFMAIAKRIDEAVRKQVEPSSEHARESILSSCRSVMDLSDSLDPRNRDLANVTQGKSVVIDQPAADTLLRTTQNRIPQYALHSVPQSLVTPSETSIPQIPEVSPQKALAEVSDPRDRNSHASTTNAIQDGPITKDPDQIVSSLVWKDKSEVSQSSKNDEQERPVRTALPKVVSVSTASLKSVERETSSDKGEMVVGISRQRTEDLIALLGSARSSVATAALVELESRGLSSLQLEIAVDLARGTKQEKLMCAEKILQQQDFDPVPWLGWLAMDRDRDVRLRSIGILSSLNSHAARTRLRLLVNRERDTDLVKQIQQGLLQDQANVPSR